MKLARKWVRIELEVAAEAEEAAAEGLRALGAAGTEHRESPGGTVTVSAVFAKEAAARLGAGLEDLRERLSRSGLQTWPPRLRQEELEEGDWAEEWKKLFHPVRVGSIWIRPSWEGAQAPPGTHPIVLDPGLAFGTGTHATTQLCLQGLEERLVPGQVVVDVGTGTGILAMAAALLGARRVVAVDVDPIAVRVARENVLLNRLQWAVEVLEGSVEAADSSLRRDHPAGADLVVANLLTPLIVEMARPLSEAMAPRGILLASGIAGGQEREARAAVEGVGMRMLNEVHREGWCLLVVQRPETP